MLACARLGAVHSVVFGGFGAARAGGPDRRRPAEGDRGDARAASRPARVVPYKPMLDAAIDAATHRPDALRDPAAPAACRATLRRGPRPDLGRRDRRRRAGRVRAGRGDRSALHPLHLRHHREAEGRGAGQRRARGRAALVDGERLRDRAGRRLLGGLRRRLGGRPLLHRLRARCSPARPPCSTRASRSARRTPARSGGSSREHRVTAMFTAPTAIRAIKKEDPEGKLLRGYDLSSLRVLFLAGERLDPETYAWAGELLGVPVVDNWWQTETGWPIAASPRGLEELPIKAGSPSVPVPGYRVRVVDGAGDDVPAGRGRLDRDPAAAAARLPAHPVGRRRAVRALVPVGVPRQLPDRRRRPVRRRRLPVRDGPHRRRDQRGRAPAVHRRDGGGAGRATRRSPSAR